MRKALGVRGVRVVERGLSFRGDDLDAAVEDVRRRVMLAVSNSLTRSDSRSEWELMSLAGRIPYAFPHTTETPNNYQFSHFWNNFTYGHP